MHEEFLQGTLPVPKLLKTALQYSRGNTNITEEIQSAKAVENELSSKQQETFGLVQMFSACSLNNADPPIEGKREPHWSSRFIRLVQ